MRAFFKSFLYAFAGIYDFFRNHRNGQFHLVASIVATGMGMYFHLKPYEWVVVLLCIMVVTALEAMNSAVEYLTDLVSPDYHPLAGKVKDMAAGAVLMAAVGAAVVGVIIFGPYLTNLF